MRHLVLVVALAVGLSEAALASSSACPNTANGSALNSFPNTNTPPFGCAQADVSFDNFAVSTDVGSNAPNPPGIGDVSLYTTGALPSVTAFFDTPGTNAWSVSTVGDQLQSIVSYTATTSDAFTGLSLPLSAGDFSGSGSTFTITETFCLGQATVTVGCNGGSTEVVVAGSSVFTAATPQTFAPTTEIAIQDEIVMQNGYTLLTLTNQFTEATPEPSTFALLGTALGGLAFLRVRRRGMPRS